MCRYRPGVSLRFPSLRRLPGDFMNTLRHSRCALLLTLLAVLLAPLPIGSGAPPVAKSSANDPILKWNAIALQAVVDDHSGTFGPPDQGGPTRAARALA